MIKNLTYLMMGILFFSNVQAEQNRSQKAKVMFKYTHPCPSTGKTKAQP